MSYSEVLV